MTQDELFSYIRSQKWFFGVRADAALLFYSSKQEGVRKYVKGMQGVDFAETILVPQDGKPVRVINIDQAKDFHEASKKAVLANPHVLVERIKENDRLWVRIARECEALDRSVKAKDVPTAIADYKRIAESYAQTGAQFIVIFSLGLKLTEAGVTPETKQILAQHDVWRNTVAFKEELMGEVWYDFFAFLAEQKRIGLSALDLMRYFSLPEIYAWLDGQTIDLETLAEKRSTQGFVYLDLYRTREVVDDAGTIAAVGDYFADLDVTKQGTDGIVGQVAYAGEGNVTGEVVVVRSKEDLDAKAALMAGKVLVAVQTTPHFIPYLKGVKAIVTDEGGITCHAAIVSREMRIPCVVGTKIATRELKDGDKVELDLEKGKVNLMH